MSQLPFDPLLAAIAAPLVVALAIALGLPKRFSVKLAYAGFTVPALLALHCWYHFPADAAGGYAFVTQYDTGLTLLGISLKLGLNGVSLPLFVMAGIVGLAAGLYAIQSSAERLKLYLMLLLIMHGGLMGVFASVDVFFFYFFHELALIPTFIMVGIWGGRDRHYAAMKLTIYLTLGAMLSLAGLIAIYVQSGAQSFDLVELRRALTAQPLALGLQKYLFGLLLFGFGILVSLWPFHTWAPLGYGAAPSSAAMLHAGVLKKFGLYGFVQIALPLLPQGAPAWTPLLAWLALGNIVIIGLITIAQRDLKQMVGYASVMHVGYGFLGVACLSALGAGGVVLFMVAHGLTVALLFLLATSVHHRTGTFDMQEMGGLAQKAPVLAAFFLTAMLASIGLPGPGLLNFWGELTIFMAVYNHAGWMVVPAVLGVVISAIYGLRAVGRIFYGQPTDAFLAHQQNHPVADLRWSERVPVLILLVTLIALGLWPRAISEPLNATLQAVYPAVEAAATRLAP
ncbi:MAG: NADH-quinone oxidoreductase subunit M [Opitutaceae bacterium]|nr:NADH-quinone oxidoreductase subunit M [Opitutaceae bacterium]